MSYQVIARKYRPQTFRDLVGQTHVTETLGHAIEKNRVAHAYIFSGARGVGKTTAARILAKALNCAKGATADPCGECPSCQEIAGGTSLDVIEIDAASNRGIDQIRELRDMVRYAPAAARSKVVILDEAHMLTSEASNALLKTLEEPPDRVIFVMATTEPENLADTIRSRSQHFHFRALTFAEIAGRIEEITAKEGLKIESGALGVIARAAEGSLRDALSLLEQARAFCGEEIRDQQVRELMGIVPEDALEELTGAIEAGSAERALALVHRFQKEGRNLQHFCREAIRHMRNLLIARVAGADSELIAATPEQRPRLAESAARFSEEDLTRYFQILLEMDEDLRRKPDPRVHLEMGVLRMVNAARLAPLEQLLAEMGRGAAPAAGGGTGGTSRAREAAAPAPRMAASAAASASAATPAAASFAPAKASFPAPAAAAPAMRNPAPSFSAPPATPARTEAPETISEDQVEASAEKEPQEAKKTFAESSGNGHPAVRAEGLEPEKVEEIKALIQAEKKFLGELVEHVQRWELSGAELRLYFSAENRSFADLLEGRDSLEKVRGASSKALGKPVRVCVKLETGSNSEAPRGLAGTQGLRAQAEGDPLVRAVLQRFGGRITGVTRQPKE